MPMRGQTETQRYMVKYIYTFFYRIRYTWFVCTERECFIRYHEKTLIKEGGRYKISLEEDQTLYHMAKLEIINVENSDRGEYRAVAKNKHGEGTAKINLNFEGSGKPK